MTENNPSPVVTDNLANQRRRKLGLTLLGTVCVLAAAAWGIYWLDIARWIENTDDAYVNGRVLQITPQVGGTVLAVRAEDTDDVKAGQVLVELDRADARVALEQAETALAQAVRETRTVFANSNTLVQQIKLRQAEAERWRQDIARRQAIAETGAVSMEEIYHARDSLKAAEAALATAQEQLVASQTQTDGIKVENHPAVQRAAARYEEAWLAWSRTSVTAPVNGQIARRNVQIGQRVAPGTPLMTVVPLDQVWVDANFKEVQLRRMQIGQAVKLHADVYGSSVEYRGRVLGLGAGTGAAFSLLPAQNATGNWIKVVQRIPVRIGLDPQELAAHPLRIGLSMQVEVDTHEGHAASISAPAAPNAARFETADAGIEQARARVQEIIRQNLHAAAHG
ncbi:MAG: emrA [Proteobacteria bacterium]|nr:emrA [Pseudomonadota bacterium]